MTHFPPTVMPTTFCEVTYDSDWFEPDDRHLTPYRYSLMRNDDSNSDTVSLTLPSYTYYEYLRSLYDCRTTPSRIPPGYHCPPGSHLSEQGRATTWHAFNKDTGSELSRQAVRSEPTRIRPTYPFPSLHLIQQGGDSGDELEEEYAYADRTKEKLVWVDALNKWVPQKQQLGGGDDVPLRAHTCERFEGHMGVTRPSVSQPQDRSSNKTVNNEKREAIRRRAQELAEQRRQRKAYSTPLYTSMNERKQKARVQSSRTPQSMPVSPTPQRPKERAPPPKQVWQADESPGRLGAKPQPSPTPRSITPVKKEISITLVAPKPEDLEVEDDNKDKSSEKKVTFTDKRSDQNKTPTEKKKKDENSEGDRNNNNADDTDAKLAEQKLIESLEKQHQLQQQQQQQLLQAEQQKEAERKARAKAQAKAEEEERLRKLKESNNMHKQPLSQKTQNHENYYENTMNAAGHLFSHKTPATTESKTKIINVQPKLSKPEPKKTVTKDSENKNIVKNTNSKENAVTGIEKTSKVNKNSMKTTTSINGTVDSSNNKSIIDTSSDNETEVTDGNKETKVSSKSAIKPVESSVKVKDSLTMIEETVEVEDTVTNVKVTQARRRKGKGKTPTVKVAKPEKVKKTKKTEEEKPATSPRKDNTVNSGKFVNSTTPPPLEKNDIFKPKETLTKKRKASKPILAGMGASQKLVASVSQKPPTQKPKPKKEPEVKLPITKPSEIEIPKVEEVVSKPESPASDRRRSIVGQREVVKKERRDARRCSKKSDEETIEVLPELDIQPKAIDSWIFEQDDFSEQQEPEKVASPTESIPALPSLSADLNPELIAKQKREKKEQRRKAVLASLINTENAVKKIRKPGKLDNSYADELRRLELAEERRKRQMEMYERLRNRKMNTSGDMNDDGSPNFEDYGFLSKYCIFTKGNIEMYRHAFEAVDIDSVGWLEGEDVMIALRGVNNRLTEAEEEYLYRVLELTGYKITHGADFKMFSVLAALSQRIVTLDKWMKNLIGTMDFKTLEMKMFKCKTLWECNVDRDTNKISIDQLCVDLRAGGVSFEHELEVREKLSHLNALDLLDFLTYIPLFIMIHESVVKNPLDDTRDK